MMIGVLMAGFFFHLLVRFLSLSKAARTPLFQFGLVCFEKDTVCALSQRLI